MPATQEVSERLIRENINRAIGDVFKTMLSRPIELRATEGRDWQESWPPLPPPPQESVPHIVGTVGFLGDINGLIYLYLDVAFANLCTSLLLGTEGRPGGVAEDSVNDAIGELTNMIVGVFKNGLCDAGYSCKLTIPSILRGRNFFIEPISSAQRFVYCFESQGHRVVADILMKGDE
jgi:chemotaxis protein CheX